MAIKAKVNVGFLFTLCNVFIHVFRNRAILTSMTTFNISVRYTNQFVQHILCSKYNNWHEMNRFFIIKEFYDNNSNYCSFNLIWLISFDLVTHLMSSTFIASNLICSQIITLSPSLSFFDRIWLISIIMIQIRYFYQIRSSANRSKTFIQWWLVFVQVYIVSRSNLYNFSSNKNG